MSESTATTRVMPALFLGLGSPANAIERNAWSDAWRIVGAALPRPRAVLCISPYWLSSGAQVTAAAAPETLHEAGGAPALAEVRYPAPGDPALARQVVSLLGSDAGIAPERGLDQGAWGVLMAMFPDADIPVLQLGLDTRRDGAWHYALARRLAPLRDEGLLILATGNIVHNLRLHDERALAAHAWAIRFRDTVEARMREGQHDALADWPSLPDAKNAVPEPAHFLPLLYLLAVGRDGDRVTVFSDEVRGAVAMTSFLIDGAA